MRVPFLWHQPTSAWQIWLTWYVSSSFLLNTSESSIQEENCPSNLGIFSHQGHTNNHCSQWELQTITHVEFQEHSSFQMVTPPLLSKIKPQWNQGDLDFLKLWSRSLLRGWRTIAHALRISSDPISTTSFSNGWFYFGVFWLPNNLGVFFGDSNQNLIRCLLLYFFLICTVG